LFAGFVLSLTVLLGASRAKALESNLVAFDTTKLVATDSLALKDTLSEKTASAASDTASLYSQPITRPTNIPGPFTMITDIPSDWSRYFTKTIQWKNWPGITLMALGTTAMVITDHELYEPFKKVYDKDEGFRNTMDAFVFMGDGKFQFGIAGLFAGYALIANDAKAWKTASETCEVILACGAVVQVLKHVTGRESPFVATTPTGKWRLFPNQIEYHKHVPHYDAFPSGHIATATATLTVIANNYIDQKWILPVGYVALAGIATGLCASGIHWWSDIPLGVALGYGFGQIITSKAEAEKAEEEKTGTSKEDQKDLAPAGGKDTGSLDWQVMPMFSSNAAGLGFQLRF